MNIQTEERPHCLEFTWHPGTFVRFIKEGDHLLIVTESNDSWTGKPFPMHFILEGKERAMLIKWLEGGLT